MNWNAVNNELSEAILASGQLQGLLSELGCDVHGSPGGISFRGRCPVHLGDGTNFELRTDGDLFPIYWACYSHRCHKHKPLKQNLLGLVRGALTGDLDRPTSLNRAVDFIRDFLGRVAEAPTPQLRPSRQPSRTSLSLTRTQVRQRLLLPSPYFLSRGFSPAVLDQLDIGDSHRLGRAVVPVYDDAGERCMGFISRSFAEQADEPRWRFPPGFPKGDYLYNHAAAARSDSPIVLLVEGVPDVLRAAEAGVAAVACFGTDPSVTQLRKLSLLNKKVLVAFDTDEPGREAAPEVMRMLRRNCVQAEIRHPPDKYKDVGEMPAPEVSAWLAASSQPRAAGLGNELQVGTMDDWVPLAKQRAEDEYQA